MPVDELFAGSVCHIVNIKMPGLTLNIRVKQHLHEHVAQLLAHVHKVSGVDRLTGLIRLLEEVAADALMRLRQGQPFGERRYETSATKSRRS